MTRRHSWTGCRTQSGPASRKTRTPRRSWRWLGVPELASPDEAEQLIQCLEDETLMRLFLTGLIGQAGTLSEETSECIRGGFSGFDLRSMMLASAAGGDEEAGMVGGMAAFFLTLSCLEEDEWAAAAPALDDDAGRSGDAAMRHGSIGRS